MLFCVHSAVAVCLLLLLVPDTHTAGLDGINAAGPQASAALHNLNGSAAGSSQLEPHVECISAGDIAAAEAARRR